MKNYYPLLALFFILFFACQDEFIEDGEPPIINEPNTELTLPAGTQPISETPQRDGDPNKGYEYLITGDYVASGPPLDIYLQFLGEDNSNVLDRTGNNAKLPHFLNAVKAFNGVEVAAANCLTCHSERLNGQLIVGLGNNSFDYTDNQGGNNTLLANALDLAYGIDSPERLAYESFRRATATLADQLVLPIQGVNPAGKLAVVLGAHRNLETLEWNDNPIYSIPESVVPSDVPPWWHTAKKNALYYAGIGRGDHSRTIMAASILTLQDIEEAEKIDQQFPDVLSFLKTIEPPVYPTPVNIEKSERGKAVFNRECAKCHGIYGDTETYPNLLVDLDVIKTDPLLASSNYGYDRFVSSYNSSWFGQGANGAKLVATNGYIAPPLDGIWATAPYLHNGSIPTLEDLLNSDQRPTFWERSFDSSDINYDKVGWNYTERTEGNSKTIYNTTLPGYGNQGHIYGDRLSGEERSDLLEYLKTL